MYEDMDERLSALEQRLGVVFQDRKLLLKAVTHCSYRNEHRVSAWGNNEVLEFLGDAVLELCVREHLVKRFTKESEGGLTVRTSTLVKTETLARVGEELRVADVLLMSKGQMQDFRQPSKTRIHLLACAFEAILGALYTDQGIGACRFVVDHLLHTTLSRFVSESRDYKTELQEQVQAMQKVTPTYQTLQEIGPDHEKCFLVAVFIDGKKVAEGSGGSKKEAEKAAAKAALALINI